MNAQRKIIAYIATSADGYIARPDSCLGFAKCYGKNVLWSPS